MAQELVASATLTIANGQTISSDSVRVGHWSALVMDIPASVDGSNITFLVSEDDSTFLLLTDLGGSQTAATNYGGAHSVVVPSSVTNWPYFKLQTGSTQTASRTFTISAAN